MEITIPSIKEIVKNRTVKFEYYRAGFFYYSVDVDGKVYQFPVDREDVGDATLNANDKALIFMRWIRKAVEGNQLTLIADWSRPVLYCEDCKTELLARIEMMTGLCEDCSDK